MGKVVKKKKSSSIKTSSRKRPVTLSYSRTIIITTGVLLLTLFLFVSESQRFQEQRGRAAGTNCDAPAGEAAMSVTENNLLQLINQYRQSKGAPALVASTTLSQSAAWMSADMNSHKTLAHVDSLGRDLPTRIQQCGYTGSGVGENVAQGTGTAAQEIFDLWKTSTEGHNEEMLDPNHKVVGIGQSGMFWTADFGDAVDGAPAAPSSGTSAITPSFFPLAPCPSCATPSTVVPSVAQTTDPVTNPQPAVSTEPDNPGAVEEDPTISGVPALTTGGGQGQGGIMDILNMILQFLKQLLEQLFGGGGEGEGDGNGNGGYNGGEEKKSYKGGEEESGGKQGGYEKKGKEEEEGGNEQEEGGEKGAAKNEKGNGESQTGQTGTGGSQSGY